MGETNSALFFFPGTKYEVYEVYKYFNQKIYFFLLLKFISLFSGGRSQPSEGAV